MEVILRPLRKSSWAGVYNYKNCSNYIGTYLTRSGAIYTGLTDEDAKRLGEKIGKGLHPSSEFWLNFYIRTSSKDIYLHLDDPWDELRYLFLKSHKRVKDGFSDRNPYADFVLINKEIEATESNKINQIKRKAMKEFDKLSLSDMRKVLRLFGHKSDNLSADLVESKLFDIVEKDPSKFFEKWIDNSQRETDYLIQEAVSKNVIRRNKSEYKYGTDVIGHNLEDAISYLDSPQNRDLKAIIINEVNSK
jgi:RAB protein geranylgeranyltransferase component A